MKKSLFILFSLVLISCSSTKLVTPTQADVERGSARFSNLTLDELNTGKMNFEKQCNKCHGLGKPSTKSADELNKIVPRMVIKANKKAGKEVIDAAMQESILKYLVTMAKK